MTEAGCSADYIIHWFPPWDTAWLFSAPEFDTRSTVGGRMDSTDDDSEPDKIIAPINEG